MSEDKTRPRVGMIWHGEIRPAASSSGIQTGGHVPKLLRLLGSSYLQAKLLTYDKLIVRGQIPNMPLVRGARCARCDGLRQGDQTRAAIRDKATAIPEPL
ncbi:LOW QUALITY PROTEIN: hypothetical protein FOVG_00835 [Fusarium oxysporum f. sp. pisi HDV247]|uniref:Uncharacterized protein n=1 Tax=Fusarium oxysporum f. sp. pisi HDV247 TaxID=1080344 RepID=W9QBG7_FUSOX|nr:LOW QUALITY PROTEIN: hypothetical protein FOVG_00835 [Fusarium oxysporum f. sp. pisi HDV247]